MKKLLILALLSFAACGDGLTSIVDASPGDGTVVGSDALTDATGSDDAVMSDATVDGMVIDATIPDAAPDAMFVCDPRSQSGCMEGEKCAYVPFGKIECVTDGIITKGNACMGPFVDQADNCVAGTHCIDGTCMAICNLEGNCESATSCVDIESLPFDVCMSICDPLGQNCNNDGHSCYLTGGGNGICAPSGSFMLGDSCNFLNHCAEGLGCFNGSTGGICRAYCDYATNPAMADAMYCAESEICGPITGYADYGVCGE